MSRALAHVLLSALVLAALTSARAQRGVQGTYASDACGCGRPERQITISNGLIQGPDFRCELYTCDQKQSVANGSDCPRPAKLDAGREIKGLSAGSGLVAYGATCVETGGRSKTGVLTLDFATEKIARPGKPWAPLFDCKQQPLLPAKQCQPSALASAAASPPGGPVDRSTVDQALELLKAALECPSEAETTSKIGKNVVTLRSRGDRQVLVIERQNKEFMVGDLSWTKYYEAVGSTKSVTRIFAANLAKLQEPVVNGADLQAECVESEPCISEFFKAQVECDQLRNGKEQCTSGEIGDRSVHSTQTLGIHGICRSQVDNARLALALLIRGAKHTAPPRGSFRVSGLVFGYAVPIRSAPDRTAPIVGGLPRESGPVALADCQAVPGYQDKWCRIEWGGIKGWVSMTRLAPSEGVR
jgi:hypothetical protein